MSKDECSTPGPFYREGNLIYRSIEQHSFLSADVLDETERDELVELLNKGTHFEKMLEALSRIAGECIGTGGAPDVSGIERVAMTAIAEATGDVGLIEELRTAIPQARGKD